MSDLFIGVLGHDLRNPLSSIVSGATLLELEAGDAEKTKRRARVILDASRRMSRLIQQLLDFALARVKGAIPIEPVDVDLEAVAQQVIGELRGTRDVELELATAGNVRGVWDADRVMQVLSNLAGNAVEHGEPGTLVSVVLDGTLDDLVTLLVENRGAIPHETRDVLFSPFKPRARGSHGLGLGLYIVDQIVSAHGGQIRVEEPEPGKTRFVVSLPRRSAPRGTPSSNA